MKTKILLPFALVITLQLLVACNQNKERENSAASIPDSSVQPVSKESKSEPENTALLALQEQTLVDGESIGHYFNRVAGVGGIVNWTLQNSQGSVSNYNVTVLRRKSHHPVDLDVTFIYDSKTQNYEVDKVLWEGHKQSLNNVDECFRSMTLLMLSGFEEKD